MKPKQLKENSNHLMQLQHQMINYVTYLKSPAYSFLVFFVYYMALIHP